MDAPDFHEYVDVLRQRIFDYEVVHNDNTIPNFDELMADFTNAPDVWPEHAYDELMAEGHLNPNVSGVSSGPHYHGLLSADGRLYVRTQREAEPDTEQT